MKKKKKRFATIPAIASPFYELFNQDATDSSSEMK